MKTFKDNNNIIWRECSRTDAIKAFNNNERIYINKEKHFKNEYKNFTFEQYENLAKKYFDNLTFYIMRPFALKVTAPTFSHFEGGSGFIFKDLLKIYINDELLNPFLNEDIYFKTTEHINKNGSKGLKEFIRTAL